MSEKEYVEKSVHSHNFQTCSFCGHKANDVEVIIVASDNGPNICNECVRLCESILTEKTREYNDFKKFPGDKFIPAGNKMRSVAKIPKNWIVSETDLYASIPSVIATSPDGKKVENFSVPKQLALWMISNDQKIDLEELRKEIKKEILDTISWKIRSY